MYYETVRELSIGVRPEILYWKQRSFRIIWWDPMYLIKKYIMTHGTDKKLQKLFILHAWHPNAGIPTSDVVGDIPPPKQEFCLPEWVVGIEIDYMILDNLECYVLNRWWLDDPHHYPVYGKHFKTDPLIGREYSWRE